MTMMERLRMVLSSEVTSVTSTVQTLVLDLWWYEATEDLVCT